MEHKIIEKKDNPLLNREELKVIVEAEKNPSFQEASKIISEITGKEEENIAVRGIKGKFGRKTFLILVNIYDSKEAKEKIEPRIKEKDAEEKKEEKKAQEEKKTKQK